MIEYRTVGGNATAKEGVLNGLVTPFNVWTSIGDVKRGGFKERIAPGTFSKTLQERDVVLINNHDTGQPMARTSIADGPGSLTLREDPNAGLRAVAQPVETSYAKDVMALAEAGVVRGMSFGFEVIKDSWTDDTGRASNSSVGTQRTIHEVRLHEVTTTAFPAYATTELSARDTVNAARGVSEARAADPEGQGTAEDAEINAANKCAMCGQDIPGDTPDNPGADGDGDSDHDDQVIDRSSEPGETTPELTPEEIREFARVAYGV